MILTIGVVLYNEEKRLSLLRENLATLCLHSQDLQIIVVDNSSTDTTASLLRGLQAQFNFQLKHRDKNHLGEARQDVVNAAGTPWVAFFDGDCRVSESWLKHFLALEPELPKHVAAIGGPLMPGGKRRKLFTSLFSGVMGHFNSSQVKAYEKELAVEHIPTANVFYRLEWLGKVGGFRDLYPRVGEDLDLSYRLRRNGGELRIDPRLKMAHELPETLWLWFRKVFIYGWGRALVGFYQKAYFSQAYMLPLLYFLTFVLTGVFTNRYFLTLWFCYLGLTLILSMTSFRKVNFMRLWVYMVATHFGYALGMGLGVLAIIFGYRGKTIYPLSNKVLIKGNK